MADSSLSRATAKKSHSRLVDFSIRLVKEKPLGTIGAVITLLLLFTGIFADFLAPFGYNETQAGDFLTAPSARFWLGTDNLGRDMLSRIIFGARISLIVGLAATSLSTLLATSLGVLCGYFGGTFDLIVQRFVDGWMCLPYLPILMVAMSVVGPGMLGLIIVMGIWGGISGSRFSRSVVISIKENVYVDAAAAVGCNNTRILIKHILPNILAPIIISFSSALPGVVIGEAALSFLGFGIPPPIPSWGGMLSGSGRNYMFMAPWMVIWPGVALGIVVYGINMFGDAVRDLLDPRMRGGAGRYGVSKNVPL